MRTWSLRAKVTAATYKLLAAVGVRWHAVIASPELPHEHDNEQDAAPGQNDLRPAWGRAGQPERDGNIPLLGTYTPVHTPPGSPRCGSG
jgi:hypothetical protein